MLASMKLTSARWRLIYSLGVPAIGLAAGIIELIRLSGDDHVERYPWGALILASVGALVFIGTLEVIGRGGPDNRKEYGWLGIVIGADGRISTSKTQTLLWTLGLGVVMLYLAGIVAFGPTSAANIFNETSWDQYVILLGGPFAAAVLSKLAVTSKIEDGALSKSVTSAASGQLGLAAAPAVAVAPAVPGAAPVPPAAPAAAPATAKDVVANDSGEIDLVDTQYLLFNIVAFVYVAVVFVSHVLSNLPVAQRFQLPDVPEVLLGLTSLSALTYVGNKTVQKSGPRIISVVAPSPAAVGSAIDITGVSLVPAGVAPADALTGTSVMLRAQTTAAAAAPGASAVLAPTAATATKVSFVMPAGFAAATTVDVRVVTTTGVTSEPVSMAV